MAPIGSTILPIGTILWVFPRLGVLLITFVSICITFWFLSAVDRILLTPPPPPPPFFFLDARLDLSDGDNAVILTLAGCSARPYSELIRSDIPGSSSLKPAKSSALRPSPPSTLGVFPFGPAAAAPTRGEILVHLEGISRKPRSVKRRRTDSPERDQLAHSKFLKLEMPPSVLVQGPERASSPLASLVSEPERASSPLAEVPLVLCSLPSSEPIAEVGNPSGGDQPLAAMPLTVWNASSDTVKSPPGKVAERRKPKPKFDEIKGSLLSNAELAAGAVSSILNDSDIGRSKELPVDEALALSFQGFASVSL